MPATPANPRLSRNVVITGSVVLFHVGALWALQSGLVRRAVEVIVPVAMLSETITPPVPQVEPQPAREPEPAPRRVVQRKASPAPSPAPLPVAVPEAAPTPNAPTGTTEPAPSLPPIAAPVAVAAAPVAPPPPPKVELPSSDAAYLQNPRPAYPAVSRRLGEQGKVLVRVLIGVDGTAQQAELQQSSGYDRLDQAAVQTVRKWRYVPGKRAGVPEAMWFTVPIQFVLE